MFCMMFTEARKTRQSHGDTSSISIINIIAKKQRCFSDLGSNITN